MDLFYLLRLSFYAMAATSALALSIATRNPLFFVGTVIGATLAHVTLDRRRAKPVRMEYIAALAIAVLFYTLLPLRERNGWERHSPACFAHLLAALQILLFFLPFRAPVLLTSFFFGLAVVILSGVMDPHASLLLRMALFVAVTAWALFIHALWNSRERFSRRASVQSSRLSARAPMNSQPENAVPRRAVWQGLTMIGLLTLSCLIVGLFLYFSAPRLDDTVRTLVRWVQPESDLKPTSSGQGIGTSKNSPRSIGWSEDVDLLELGPVHENQRSAVAVTFTSNPAEIADSQRRIYLRGLVLSRLRDGKWVRDMDFENVENPAGPGTPLVVQDPSLGGVPARGIQVQQQIETLDARTRTFLATGTILRLGVPAAQMNRDGMLRLPGEINLSRYTVWSALPIHPDHFDGAAQAFHPDDQARYTETTLSTQDTNALRTLLISVTPASDDDLQEALAIERFLRENKRFQYTLKLDELDRKPGHDPVVEFLLSEDPLKRRGHCSYFASAFVTLCRLRGIPSRLAGGFAAELNDDARESRKMVFKNSDAHAWAEVYFKNTGWVIFDPTPGEPDPNTALAQTTPRTTGGGPAASQSLWSQVLNFDGQQQREMYARLGVALQESVGGAGDVFLGESLFGWIGAAIAWLGAAIFVIYISRAFLGRGARRAGQGGGLKGRNRAAVTFYNDLLQALSRCGYVRRPEQTPREFALHVLRVGGERFRCVLDVTDVFERVRYGGGDVSQDQFNQLQTALDHLREQAFVSAAPARES